MRLIYLYYAIFSFIPGLFFSSWLTSLDRMGLGLNQAALSYAYFMMGQAVLELPTGYLADTWGRKRTTIVGLCVYVAAFGGIYFTVERVAIYSLLVAAGIGQTLMSGAQFAWFLDVLERRSKRVGMLSDSRVFFLRLDLIRRVNLAFGAFVGAIILSSDPKNLWCILGISGFLALVIAVCIEGDSALLEDQVESKRVEGLIDNLRNPMLIGMLLMGLFYGIEIGNRDTIMQPFVVGELGRGDPYGMIIIQGGVAIFGIIGNRMYAFLRRRSSANHVTGLDILLMSSSLIVMGIVQGFASGANSIAVFSALYFVGVLAISWFYPLQSFILNALIGRSHRAMILSLENMLECLSQSLICVIVSSQLGFMPAGKFWYIGMSAIFVSVFVVVVGYVLSKKFHDCVVD